MLALRHTALAALLTAKGLAASEPPLLEFFQEGVPGAPLLRREEAPLPRHRDQREALEAAEDPGRGQESVLPENHGVETLVREASLLHMQVGKHGSNMSHDCSVNTDCVDELCGVESEAKCVQGWCFTRRPFRGCESKPKNYILEDGGLCTDGRRESLCPAKGCKDMPISVTARSSSFSVAIHDATAPRYLKGFLKCDDILKWEGISCQLKPIAIIYCRKTCNKCNSFAPWDSQPPDAFTKRDPPVPAKTGVDEGPDIDTVKEFEGEEERIEKKVGEEVMPKSKKDDGTKDEAASWFIMIGICALLVTLIFGSVGVIISNSKLARAEAKLAAMKSLREEDQYPQEQIEAPEADAAETAAAESPEIPEEETSAQQGK